MKERNLALTLLCALGPKTIFADDSYSKPYFVTYLNTTSFCFFLLAVPLQQLHFSSRSRARYSTSKLYASAEAPSGSGEATSFLGEDRLISRYSQGLWHNCVTWSRSMWKLFGRTDVSPSGNGRLSIRATARLSLEFCLLWFAANYSVAAGLEYTTVGSSTILTSTSSIWTLVFGVLVRVEAFSLQKLIGVFVSICGVAMISKLDFSGETDSNRGEFPHKSTVELAIGDLLSLASAVLYGTYSVLMKKRIRDESRVNMFLFFGFVCHGTGLSTRANMLTLFRLGPLTRYCCGQDLLSSILLALRLSSFLPLPVYGQ